MRSSARDPFGELDEPRYVWCRLPGHEDSGNATIGIYTCGPHAVAGELAGDGSLWVRSWCTSGGPSVDCTATADIASDFQGECTDDDPATSSGLWGGQVGCKVTPSGVVASWRAACESAVDH